MTVCATAYGWNLPIMGPFMRENTSDWWLPYKMQKTFPWHHVIIIHSGPDPIISIGAITIIGLPQHHWNNHWEQWWIQEGNHYRTKHKNVCIFHGPLARYVKLRVAHAPGMLRMFSPSPRVGDPNMHHGTCETHVPWCMTGSLTSCFLWIRWRGKRSRHSRRMRNPQFIHLARGPWDMLSNNIELSRNAVHGSSDILWKSPTN